MVIRKGKGSRELPLQVRAVDCFMNCSVCGREIKSAELTGRAAKVRLELIPMKKDQSAMEVGCRLVLDYNGKKFGIRSAAHEACLG